MLPVGSLALVSSFSGTLGIRGSFSSLYLAARPALMADSESAVWLGSSSMVQTWLLVQRT
jgi:hypothetical protein